MRERERERFWESERERRKRREHSQEEYVSRKTSRLDSPTPRFQVVFLTLSYLLLPWYLFYCISVIYQGLWGRHLTKQSNVFSQRDKRFFFGFVFDWLDWRLTERRVVRAQYTISPRKCVRFSLQIIPMCYLLVEYVYYCCINAKLRSRRIAVSSPGSLISFWWYRK